LSARTEYTYSTSDSRLEVSFDLNFYSFSAGALNRQQPQHAQAVQLIQAYDSGHATRNAGQSYERLTNNNVNS